jgi:hypothetical protein
MLLADSNVWLAELHQARRADVMNDRARDLDHLRQQIESAFADVEYPGDDRLVSDTSGYDLECNDVAALFKGKHWKDVSLETLLSHSGALPLLTPEAYRFYLPAYLLAGSLRYEDADVVPYDVVSSLPRAPDPELDTLFDSSHQFERRRKKMEALTPLQRQAVKSFLEFLKKYHADDDPIGSIDAAIAAL